MSPAQCKSICFLAANMAEAMYLFLTLGLSFCIFMFDFYIVSSAMAWGLHPAAQEEYEHGYNCDEYKDIHQDAGLQPAQDLVIR